MTRPICIILLFLGILTACRQDEPQNHLFRNDAIKIEVAETGVYRITPAMLENAGLEIKTLTAETTHLQQGATTVPFLIDEGNLLFYGQAPTNRYTAVRTYLLELNKAGALMAETAVPQTGATILNQLPITLHLEENNLYEASALPTLPDADQNEAQVDLWFWETLDLRLKKLTIPLELSAVADGSALLKLRLWGQSENPQLTDDHDVDVVVNGRTIGTLRWDGKQFYEGNLDVQPGNLKTGENQIILDNEVPGASFLDIMLFDWLEVTYMAEPVAINDRIQFEGATGQMALTGFSERPLLFDTSDPNKPSLLTDWAFADDVVQLAVQETMQVTAVAPQGYLTPANILPVRDSSWHTPEQQADLLIITTDELAPALAPLVEARQTQGLTVSIVPIAEIDDAFGQGQADPESIINFIQYVWANWQPPQPRYLFLVGEATSDYRNYLGQSPANLIPSLMVPVQFSGETVSDSRLADVDGDKRPDLAIGRWPVSQVQDVEGLVARTLAYEEGTAVPRAIFATDGSEHQFADMARQISDITHLNSEIFNGPQASEVAAQFNQGAWLTTYIGHGSMAQWGKDDVFTLDAVKQLSNTTPPLVLQLTCLTGLFAHPQNVSLAEQMLLHDGGPVLIVAATSLTLSSHQEPFATQFLQNLQNPDMPRVGDAFQAAKLSLNIEINNGLREISDTFVLLGDPSTRLIRPD